MSDTQTLSVEQAKAQLRTARLAQHKENISKHLQSGNDAELANSAGAFVALYRNKAKPKTSKPKTK